MRFESLPPAPIILIARRPDASELWRQARGDGCYGKGAFRRRSIGRGEDQSQPGLSIEGCVQRRLAISEARKTTASTGAHDGGIADIGQHLDEEPRNSGVQVIFVSEIARSATDLHQTLIEPDEVKWRLAGQGAATVLNRAAQADIVRAFPLCRVVR
jgi:hypothetical protein